MDMINSIIKGLENKGYVTEAKHLKTVLTTEAKVEPDTKDLQRMESLKMKARKDEDKAKKLAVIQAAKIGTSEKCDRRAKAAKKVMKGNMGDMVAKVFGIRKRWLQLVEEK